jgi:non-specific serine/threonine protein kinase/serine/threonine-protein kinase
MTPARWALLKAVVQQALALPPVERAEWLIAACAGDEGLRLEAQSLLEADASAGAFIETPALAREDMSGALAVLDESPTWTGRRVGPYVLVREIGHGGMGVVYLAIRSDDAYRQQVAIKVIRSTFAPEFMERRFRTERQILAELDHPNIARLLDGGSTPEGAPYFVMEYVDGVPIDQHCDGQGLSIAARLELFRQVCNAVQYAHQHLVVHRDLKPGNILVTANAVPKLLDFGIAKMIDADRIEERALTTVPSMTLESASPEQVRGETVTTAADVYSLGVLLHRLLTGRRPYEAATTAAHDLAREICEKNARRPSEVAELRVARQLRGDLDTIVLKAMQKDPARRYASVEQFGQDVAAYVAGLPVRARPDTIRYRTTKFVSRHKAGFAAGVLVVVSLAGGLVATTWEAHIARSERARAERRFNDVRRLANSFLFEFHDAIEPLPGSTKARALVVRRALEYLDGLARESADDPSLERELGSAYEKVGDVQGLPNFANLGDVNGALKSHRAALAIRQVLAARQPADTALQKELATTYSHLSAVLMQTASLADALDSAEKSLAIRRSLLGLNPNGIAERNSLAIGYHDIAALQGAMGNWPAALDMVRREADTFAALLAAEPSNRRAQRNAAIAFKQLGAHLERNDDRDGALANYRRAVALDEARLHASPNDREAHLDLSFGYASLAYTLSLMDDIDGSLDNYHRALSLREQVAALDPHDVNAADAVARAHLSIGQVYRKARRWPEAVGSFQKAQDICVRRYAGDPGNRIAGERLVDVYGALALTSADRAETARERRSATASWHSAREWAEKALGVFPGDDATHALSPTAIAARVELRTLIAKAERSLSAPPTARQ